ncbi:MAG: hypothetical protein AAFP98_13230, partial [Pseudomonadota bacterium]
RPLHRPDRRSGNRTRQADQIALLDITFDALTIQSHRDTDTLLSVGDTRMILRNTDAADVTATDFVSISEGDLIL